MAKTLRRCVPSHARAAAAGPACSAFRPSLQRECLFGGGRPPPHSPDLASFRLLGRPFGPWLPRRGCSSSTSSAPSSTCAPQRVTTHGATRKRHAADRATAAHRHTQRSRGPTAAYN
eukprot:450109-Prymnesium_polylepis.1